MCALVTQKSAMQPLLKIGCSCSNTRVLFRMLHAPIPSQIRVQDVSKGRDVKAFGLGGGQDKRKGLKREDEPDEYWTSAAERKGESPFKDPLAIIGLVAIFLPFVILGIGIAVGWVDLAGGR